MKLTPRTRKLFWNLVIVVAAVGFIYSVIEYLQYAGVWKTLMMVPLMAVLGFLAVEIAYPLWFRSDR